MKVLWFSNTPAGGAAYLNSSVLGGGWLSSLDNMIQDKLELHVAFYYPKEGENFRFKNTRYYPICKKNWKLNIIQNIFREKVIDEEDLELYLKIIHEIIPDIIHIHGTENPFGCLIPHVNIPVVVSIQGNINVVHHKFNSGLEAQYLKTVFRFAALKNLKTFIFNKSFNYKYKAFSKMLSREEKNLRSSQYIIGRTDWDRRITRVMANKSQYFHGEEMLRESFYTYKWQKPKNNKFTIFTTNGNSPYKGFESLCAALFELNKLGIQLEWKVAGVKNEDAIVSATKRKLKEKYPTKGLTLLGPLKEQSLVEGLLNSDLYVMPSHIENSPNNLCEAMILGLPCIATYAGGTGSMLLDKEEGILVQDGDPWVLAGAILELIQDQETAFKMGAQARKRALVRHDRDKLANNLIKTYQDIISLHCEEKIELASDYNVTLKS